MSSPLPRPPDLPAQFSAGAALSAGALSAQQSAPGPLQPGEGLLLCACNEHLQKYGICFLTHQTQLKIPPLSAVTDLRSSVHAMEPLSANCPLLRMLAWLHSATHLESMKRSVCLAAGFQFSCPSRVSRLPTANRQARQSLKLAPVIPLPLWGHMCIVCRQRSVLLWPRTPHGLEVLRLRCQLGQGLQGVAGRCGAG